MAFSRSLYRTEEDFISRRVHNIVQGHNALLYIYREIQTNNSFIANNQNVRKQKERGKTEK